MTPRELIATIPRVQRIAICRDYEHFENEGVLGDCTLRDYAEQYLAQFLVARLLIVTVMRDLAYESYRALAREALGPGAFDE